MINQMRCTEVFCLRNWAGCANSLQITLKISYAGGMPDTEIPLDILNGNNSAEGLMIQTDLGADGLGLLYFGLDNTNHLAEAEKIVMHLESFSGTVSSLGLEYAVCDPVDAYYHKIKWEETPLLCDSILFSRQGESISVRMQNKIPCSLEKKSETIPEQNFAEEDISGDIQADLRMIQYFSGSQARKAEQEFRNLLARLPEITPQEAEMLLHQYEVSLTDCILRTQEDIRAYRKQDAS